MKISGKIKSIKTPGLQLAVLFFLSIAFAACTQVALYEKNKPIPGYQWKSDQPATGSIEIKDTLVPYNIYIVLRHSDAYRYNNIWLNVGLQAPGDTAMKYQKLNIVLGTDAKGWEGTGMDDIWEVRKLIVPAAPVFSHSGTYKFSISQVMRDDPLQYIMSAGLRVEKTKP